MTKIWKLLNTISFYLSGFLPRNPRKVVFGAWLGTKFADNPMYLLRYLAAEAPELDLVWIGKNSVRASLPDGVAVRFLRHGSVSALFEAMTARYFFITHGIYDVAALNVLRGATVVYLGHGLALKHMGTPDDPSANRVVSLARRVTRKPNCWAFLIACSEKHVDKLLREYAINGAMLQSILKTGQPRIDFLIANQGGDAAQHFRETLLSERGLSSTSRIISYLPTFRDNRERAFSFLALNERDQDRLQEMLQRLDVVILEKSHFADAQREGSAGSATTGRVIGLTAEDNVDTQELLLSTNLLITDYSGCYFDFLALDRPILHFAYDRSYYTTSDRGLHFDLDEAAGGPIVESFDALCTEIVGSEPRSIPTSQGTRRVRRIRNWCCLLKDQPRSARQYARDVAMMLVGSR